jgi:hypothetical protein
MRRSGFSGEFSMSGVIDGLTGATAKKAAAAQALGREQASVANARQLSNATEDASRTALVRKSARGRRLLADAGPSQLPSTVA